MKKPILLFTITGLVAWSGSSIVHKLVFPAKQTGTSEGLQAAAPEPLPRKDRHPTAAALTETGHRDRRSHPPAELPSLPPAQAGRAEDGTTVEFEVKEDGLAVAFGDIILGKVTEGAGPAQRGRYEPPAVRLWDRPEIPYLVSPELPDPGRVERALEYFAQHTPVSFVPYTGQADALVFEPGNEHCYSALGRTGGMQPVKLSAGCGTQEILHEILHALGFVHEQSRPDRDQHLEILWSNIDSKYHPQFAIVPDPLMEAERDTAFDFRSVMLYRSTTFASKPGKQTMRPQAGKPAIDPVQQGLSEGDIQRLKRMYRL